MKKKILVLLVVLLLVASTIQVAFAHHDPKPSPPPNRNGGSCNMIASWWLDEEGNWTGPGNPSPNGVQDGKRGMVHVHTKDMPDHVGDNGYTYGATHMDNVTTSHCPPPEE
jgi:hypothetical protein